MLESVEQGERIARYSFIGTGERLRFEARGSTMTIKTEEGIETLETKDPLRVLWERTVKAAKPDPNLPGFWAGSVGYAAYDIIRQYENLPDNNPDELNIPDLLFIQPEVMVIFDHIKRRIFIVAPAIDGDAKDEARASQMVEQTYQRLRGPLPGVPGERAGKRSEFKSNFTKEGYMAAVAKAVEYIHAGDIFQVVPSQRMSAELGVHPFAIYRALRMINPSPYLGYLDLGGVTLVASSPESLVRTHGNKVETLPIAGTRKRGANTEEDAALPKNF